MDYEAGLQELSTRKLLQLSALVLSELRSRGVIRSSNNPVADYAEGLVASALHLQLASKSTTGHDAVDSVGCHYEIKGRRLTKHGKSTQLSPIRGLNDHHFDFLAGVLFHEDFSVARACLVPHKVVTTLAVYRQHVNGWILHLRPKLWTEPGVCDITERVRAAQEA